jgi:hypothetical protein
MRFVPRQILALTLLAVIVLAGCTSTGSNSKDLTRAKALTLLNAVKELGEPTVQVMVTLDCYNLAQRDGLILARNEMSGDQLSPKAGQYFSFYQGVFTADHTWGLGRADLKTPLKRKATEVTGITDAPMESGTKVVQFKWEYVDVPDFVNRYTGTIGIPHKEGEALIRLYDDGWRVEQVHIQ